MTVVPTALRTWERDEPLPNPHRWDEEIGWWRHNGKTATPRLASGSVSQRDCRPRRTDGMHYANDRPSMTCADFDALPQPLGCGASFRIYTLADKEHGELDVVNILRDGVLLCNACYAQYVAAQAGNVQVGFCETLTGGPLHKEPDPEGLLASLVCGSTAELHWDREQPGPTKLRRMRQFHTEWLAEQPTGQWDGETWVEGIGW